MADIITHKKQVKIRNNLNSNRRSALKDFYKLQKKTEAESRSQPLESSSEASETPNEPPIQPNSREQENELQLKRFINQSSTAEILTKSNEVIGELNSNQSEIKSIIYNHYYDLIKLNEILINLNNPAEEQANVKIDISASINDIKSSLQSFKQFEAPFEGHTTTTRNEGLIKEINMLLSDDKLDDTTKNGIQQLLSKIDYEKHEILLLQLNDLKSRSRES